MRDEPTCKLCGTIEGAHAPYDDPLYDWIPPSIKAYIAKRNLVLSPEADVTEMIGVIPGDAQVNNLHFTYVNGQFSYGNTGAQFTTPLPEKFLNNSDILKLQADPSYRDYVPVRLPSWVRILGPGSSPSAAWLRVTHINTYTGINTYIGDARRLIAVPPHYVSTIHNLLWADNLPHLAKELLEAQALLGYTQGLEYLQRMRKRIPEQLRRLAVSGAHAHNQINRFNDNFMIDKVLNHTLMHTVLKCNPIVRAPEHLGAPSTEPHEFTP